jgi:DNA-3-methyladenine glycosylase
MYGPPGRAYVYLVYGMHDCLNVVTEPSGSPAALLIRAVEPIAGADAMRHDRAIREGRRRRGWDAVRAQRAVERLSSLPSERLATGPGLVTAAFGIDTTWTGIDLCDPVSPLRLEPRPPAEPVRVDTSPRIGIAYAGPPWTERPWRFVLVSG